METEKRLSSFRTNITKIILIVSGLIIFYLSFSLFLKLKGDISFSVVLICVLFMAGSSILILLGVRLRTLEIEDDFLLFKNFLFGKTIVVDIRDVKTYLTKEFKISIIDPLSINKFAIIWFDKDGNNKGIMILCPSVFSSKRDLKLLISNIRKSVEKGM